MDYSALYLIPVNLSDAQMQILLPTYVEKLRSIRHFVVEEIRTSRRFLRSVIPDFDIDASTFWEIDKHDPNQSFSEAIRALRSGQNVGLMSEAGCPGIADPGGKLVLLAHQSNIKVVPWIGPSSIALALMASGMNGQGFTFHGYLPPKSGVELHNKIKALEAEAYKTGYSQLFIETPYRNERLVKDLIQNLRGDTLLCIATDLTADTEEIKTLPVHEWSNKELDINKRPSIFIIACPSFK